MAFFDKVKEAGAKGLDKAKDLGEQAKLKLQKEKELSKIKDAYAAIGKVFAEEHSDLVLEHCADQAQILEDAKAAVASLEEQLAAYKKDKDED